MTEVPEYFSSKLGYKLKFKLMFIELTGRDIEMNVNSSFNLIYFASFIINYIYFK